MLHCVGPAGAVAVATERLLTWSRQRSYCCLWLLFSRTSAEFCSWGITSQQRYRHVQPGAAASQRSGVSEQTNHGRAQKGQREESDGG